MRRMAIAACLGLVVGVVLTLAAVVWYQTKQVERRVLALGMRAREIRAGDTEASVRARFGRPRDVIDAKAEPDRLAQECREPAAARQLTYEADASCVDLFGTQPPQYLLSVCLNEAGTVIRADTTIIDFSAAPSH
jgi:hypothetical protein